MSLTSPRPVRGLISDLPVPCAWQHPFMVGGHLHKRLMWELLDKVRNPNKLAEFSLETDPDDEGVSDTAGGRPPTRACLCQVSLCSTRRIGCGCWT